MNDLQNANAENPVRYIGGDLIGPVVHRWLLGLEQYLSYFNDGDTRFLFCARAGVRIEELYAIYAKGRGISQPDQSRLLWVSRIALCKGLYQRVPEQAAAVIASEYGDQTIRSVVQGLLRHHTESLGSIDLGSHEMDAPAAEFPRWLNSGSRLALTVLDYLEKSSEAFDTYLDSVIGGASRAVLIDSGWQGTGQSLLSRARKDIDWHGLYIGRILTPLHDRSIVDRVIGVLFQAESYDPEKPETAITLHRHLFETLLEPNGPSIEEIVGGPCDTIAQSQITANKTADVSAEYDPIFLLVCKYLRENGELGPAEILSRYQKAIPKLARMLINPTREEALALFSKDRSADFGKELLVPILITDPEAEDLPEHLRSRDGRIQNSLWPQGQIALEFDGKLREELQLRVSGLADDIGYFDHVAQKNSKPGPRLSPLSEAKPVVAIVTRTKNRPLLLNRAAESVAQQTYDNYLWVIVNDGGEESVVRETIDNCSVDRRRIRLVSNSQSVGMEAASNLGIRHVESDYVLIHDDDDALHPDFLKETVTYLESAAGKRYGGAVTKSEYISEEICNDQVIIHARAPYMDWVRNIQLSELMAQNLFAPIAFIYRRNLYDEIGGYNPELPVLGDWFFNLEFVLRADIKVLPKQLAYYHHRDRGDSSRSGVYSNSVIGGQSKHEEFSSVCRNMFLRKYAQNTSVATGLIMAYFTQDMRNRIARISQSNTPSAASSAQAAWASWTESDRLWVITQVLEQKARRSGWLRKRLPQVNTESSLVEITDFAKRNGIRIKAPTSFDDVGYLAQNADVAKAVSAGTFASGFEHYALNGHLEGRGRPVRG